ncbi:hypothetical protein [Legionella sp. WA2022007384]
MKKIVLHLIVGFSVGLGLWLFFNSILNKELMQSIILYYFCLFCYGLVIGLMCNAMFLSSYLGIILGQFIYLFFLGKIGSFIMIEVIYIFIFSILVIFGNAIGVLISTRK